MPANNDLMNRQTRPVAILGAGNMGTALAQMFARRGSRVVLWDFFAEVVDDINQSHRNDRYLPGLILSERVSAEASCEKCVKDAALVVLAVPSPFIVDTLNLALPAIPADTAILCAAKGIDPVTMEPIHQQVARQIGNRALLLLGGPAIANEFSRGLPAVVVLASQPITTAEMVRELLENEVFQVRTTQDLTGVALGGILKNVYAILLGYLDVTPGVGRNLEAAAVRASLYEMTALSVALGAETTTLYGLAGLGDLVATGFSADSHNRRYGQLLGRGRNPKEISDELKLLPEGARTVAVVCAWADRVLLPVPLAQFVHRAVKGGKPPLSDLLQHL